MDSAAVDGAELRVVQGDITTEDVDVVVNAANELLVHGGGLAAAIVRRGGAVIQQESSRWVAANGPVMPGTAAVTTAGDMPASHVVHVVGPRFEQGQDNEGLLRQAVRAALAASADVGADSVAFPAISSGIFGYPRAEATLVIADEAVRWLRAHPGSLSEVRLVGFDAATVTDFEAGLARAVA